MTTSEKAVAKAPGAFRTIGEVSEELGVPQHVLRFWETRFPALKPLKRGGNRRYYRPADVVLLKAINKLLYTDGYTIKGVLKLIADKGVAGLAAGAAMAAPVADEPLAAAALAA
ncbi:MAG TPA: MerR family transcriptional regulator, partial [Polymorphobacter sp.]|nr:MerR family transcriptional regulator [Polymorphobacter sp.]